MSWARRISKLGWILFVAFLAIAILFSVLGVWIDPLIYAYGIVLGIVCIGVSRLFELFEGEGKEE